MSPTPPTRCTRYGGDSLAATESWTTQEVVIPESLRNKVALADFFTIDSPEDARALITDSLCVFQQTTGR